MLDQAFEALKTYDWGVDPKVLSPIPAAIVSTHGDAGARKELETRLAAVLTSDVPRAGKDAVCRALRTIGTAVSVPPLAELLKDENLSHMARYALQVIPAPEAAQALLAALPKAPAKIKIGITSSLGARRKDVPAAPFASMLADKDPAIARAAALALGALGSPEAAKALSSAKATDGTTKAAIADSLLECAENLLAAGSKADAKAAYEKILASKPSEVVKVAATLGIAASS
jgi:HEAT repeat protein